MDEDLKIVAEIAVAQVLDECVGQVAGASGNVLGDVRRLVGPAPQRVQAMG